ncbi:MAG: hypothetical protein EBQ96_03135 [Proteobacteria bacterium]|nr:hypothetical protein [Pseudomonadota bacterium]
MRYPWSRQDASSIWARHARKMQRHEANPKILRGVFFDCHGTLFDGYPHLALQAPILSFLRHVQSIGQPVHIVSSDIKGFEKRLIASGLGPNELPHIAKRTLWDRVLREEIRLEMLVDDDELNPLPALTHLLPKNILHLS